MGKFTKTSSPMEMEAVGVLLPSPPQLPAGAGVFPKVQGWERWEQRETRAQVINRSPAGSSNEAWRQQPSERLPRNPSGTIDVGAWL